MPRRSSAQTMRVSRPRSSSRLTSRVVADADRAAARASCCIRMCQPSCRLRASSTVYSTTEIPAAMVSARSSRVSIIPCSEARVRQPWARTWTASSPMPIVDHLTLIVACALYRRMQELIASVCNYQGTHVSRQEAEKMPAGLIALALGGFGIGLTEFNIMGLLPVFVDDTAATEAQAGWLITGYALAVIVGALGLTAATTRLPRKRVLMGLLVLFIAGNAVSALAPSY